VVVLLFFFSAPTIMLEEKEAPMAGKFMIYGATGYTGKLVARAAKALGLRPLLAGRNDVRLKTVAGQHGFECRTIDLGDAAGLRSALSGIAVVLHVAGPFSRTSKPMLNACLEAKAHYLDITGEIDVFEACAARDAEARKAGIMVMPGVGFDVVPSDCLAAHLRRRLPDAIDLTLAISGLGKASRGTAKTSIESIAKASRVRRGGRIVELDAPRRDFDFGQGAKSSVVVGWGDVATAYHSTGIPDITVYFDPAPELERLLKLGGIARWLLSTPPAQRMLRRYIDRQPEGPSEAERRAGHAILLGEAVNAAGQKVASRLLTPEGYTLTAMTSLEIARRTLAGEALPGFQTPSRVFGPDFISGFAGCSREDLSA
jgi:short subunit dehydrogenase-like uncharacterized protein